MVKMMKGLEEWMEMAASKEVYRTAPENNLIRKAMKKPKSLKLAIGAMCFHCMGGTKDEMPDPGYRRNISQCTAKDCPLYPHRPYSVALESMETSGGIGDYGEGQKEGNRTPYQRELPFMSGVLAVTTDGLLEGHGDTDEPILPTVFQGSVFDMLGDISQERFDELIDEYTRKDKVNFPGGIE